MKAKTIPHSKTNYIHIHRFYGRCQLTISANVKIVSQKLHVPLQPPPPPPSQYSAVVVVMMRAHSVPDVRVGILLEERRNTLTVTTATDTVERSEPSLLWCNIHHKLQLTNFTCVFKMLTLFVAHTISKHIHRVLHSQNLEYYVHKSNTADYVIQMSYFCS